MKNNISADDRLVLTVEEARQQLGLSRGLMYQAVRIKQVPSIRVGKRILIPRHALYHLLEAKTGDTNHDSEPSKRCE